MDYSIIRLPESIMRMDLLHSYYELRSEVFIHQHGWDLPSSQGMEFEQYDIPTVTAYVLAHEGDKVVAGLRLMPCSASCGIPETSSYMIRDAYLGRLTMPSDLCLIEPPVDGMVWELTRLVSRHNDPKVILDLLAVSAEYIRLQNGSEVLCLSSPSVMRFARKSGYSPKPLGKIVSHEKERFLAYSCKLT